MGGLWRVLGFGLVLALLAGGGARAEIRAILVGVGHYVGPDVPSLQGPKNDLAAMRRLMSLQGANDVVVLQDQAATRSAVRDAIASMGRRTRAGDWVVFYYSGHGSQAKARDPDEADGLDEFLMLSGFDHTRPRLDDVIVDNDLSAWLAAAFPASVNVLQIADSCHSGTLNRSYEAPTNFVTREARPQGAAFVLPQDPAATGAASPAAPARNLVYIGASQDDQFALEAPLPGAASDSRGLLTFSLERALEARDPQGRLEADRDGDGALSFSELAAVLEVKTRQLSRARQWASVRVPAGDEATAIFKPLRGGVTPARKIAVGAGDAAAGAQLVRADGILVVEPARADLVWRAESGAVEDAQGDRIAEDVRELSVLAGVVAKTQALDLLYGAAREGDVTVEVGPRRHGERYRRAEPVALAVTHRDGGGYLTAFNLGGDGAVQLLYPLEGDGEGRLAPGGRRTELARTHVAPPFGADHVVAVITADPPKVLREALRRMDGRREAFAAALAAREALRDADDARAALALGELYTGS